MSDFQGKSSNVSLKSRKYIVADIQVNQYFTFHQQMFSDINITAGQRLKHLKATLALEGLTSG